MHSIILALLYTVQRFKNTFLYNTPIFAAKTTAVKYSPRTL